MICGDARRIPLEDGSVQCCVTSPPYWGLRKYAGAQELKWGGHADCAHEWVEAEAEANRPSEKSTLASYRGGPKYGSQQDKTFIRGTCARCGAWRGAYGLEPTIEMYVAHTVEILREVRRVLREDGVCFWNVGDSYAGSFSRSTNPGGKGGLSKMQASNNGSYSTVNVGCPPTPLGLKAKDLCLIPQRVALAAQAPHMAWLIPQEGWRGWLAGIIDGEGCIGIHHCDRQDGENRYHQFQPYLSVTMSDTAALEKCRSLTGAGTIRPHTGAGTDSRGIKTRRDTFVWRVEGDAVIPILADIFPWLIVKQPQAKMAYALWQAKNNHPHTRQGRRVPEHEVRRRLQLWERIKKANQRECMDADDLDDLPIRSEDGWWVRSMIVWAKRNPMPESVTDRPTDAYEHILMLTKSARYLWDAEAVKEKGGDGSDRWGGATMELDTEKSFGGESVNGNPQNRPLRTFQYNGTRNLRNVWTFPTQPYAGAHFATFPEELPRRCIKAATSAKGACAQCGAPWERVTRKAEPRRQNAEQPESWKGSKFDAGKTAEHQGQRMQRRSDHDADTASAYEKGSNANRIALLRQAARANGGEYANESRTIGWRPTCRCPGQHGRTVPCLVLDPFGGSGTTGRVAIELGRRAVLLDLAYAHEGGAGPYAELAARRTSQVQTEFSL